MRFPPLILACLFVSCSKPSPDARTEMDRIISAARVPARLVELRTAPTDSPSHTAIIEATDGPEVCRFTAFFKAGRWHYGEPLSLVSDGVPITGHDISTAVSIAAHKLDLAR